ncbi:unnamed protein product, partial [Rotaria magnacalcarata]
MMSIGKRKYFSITDAVSSSSAKKKRFLQLT